MTLILYLFGQDYMQWEHTLSIPTICFTFSTFLPDTIAIWTSFMLQSRSRTRFVSVGINARSGCEAIGDNVPTDDSKTKLKFKLN